MIPTTETILVTGAAGQQGGATAEHLLAAGFRVRALGRDATSPGALRLAKAGAELVVGDMDDRKRHSLRFESLSFSERKLIKYNVCQLNKKRLALC